MLVRARLYGPGVDPYASSQWRARRAAYEARHPKVCEACGYAGPGVALNHRRYPRDRPLWEVPDEWLGWLCAPHHAMATGLSNSRRMTHAQAHAFVVAGSRRRRWAVRVDAWARRTAVRVAAPAALSTLLGWLLAAVAAVPAGVSLLVGCAVLGALAGRKPSRLRRRTRRFRGWAVFGLLGWAAGLPVVGFVVEVGRVVLAPLAG